jgi:hypothetical protein
VSIWIHTAIFSRLLPPPSVRFTLTVWLCRGAHEPSSHTFPSMDADHLASLTVSCIHSEKCSHSLPLLSCSDLVCWLGIATKTCAVGHSLPPSR